MKDIGIIATIGPASITPKILDKMVLEGMTIARINTKYGSFDQYREIMRNVRMMGCKLLYDIEGVGKLDWIKKQKFDYLAVAFAETAEQIKGIRKRVGKRVKIISKIENGTGIRNIDELIAASDGIMVARGDLGRNIPIEKVPVFQKVIIKKCNMKHKMVITATEMLLSMTKSKVPERAEVSDVANAVLDGSDALMLSEETAIGNYPVLAVRTMQKIITEIQKDEEILSFILHKC